eukprot:scaffold122999_cov69-Phaeocystis_antarctica.AAC.2
MATPTVARLTMALLTTTGAAPQERVPPRAALVPAGGRAIVSRAIVSRAIVSRAIVSRAALLHLLWLDVLLPHLPRLHLPGGRAVCRLGHAASALPATALATLLRPPL